MSEQNEAPRSQPEKLVGELLPAIPQKPTGSDVSAVEREVPPEDFMPDLGGYVVTWTEEGWSPPNPGAKKARREGVLEDGRPVFVYEDGTIKSAEHPYPFIRPGTTFATPGFAKMAINARWEQARSAAAEGLIAAYMQSGSMRPPSTSNQAEMVAWAAIVASRAAIAMDANRGREGTDAARFVGQAVGLLAGKNEANVGGESGGMKWELTGKVALEALRILEERSKGE